MSSPLMTGFDMLPVLGKHEHRPFHRRMHREPYTGPSRLVSNHLKADTQAMIGERE